MKPNPSRTARFTPEQAAEIRRAYAAGGWSQHKLARHYGVAQATISNLLLAKTESYREEAPPCPTN